MGPKPLRKNKQQTITKKYTHIQNNKIRTHTYRHDTFNTKYTDTVRAERPYPRDYM